MTLTSEDDPFDPVIAERFRLLDQLVPPAVLPPVAGDLPPVAPIDRHRRRHQLVLVAAAVAVLVGASAAVLLTRGDSSSGVDTYEPASDGEGPEDAGDDSPSSTDGVDQASSTANPESPDADERTEAGGGSQDGTTTTPEQAAAATAGSAEAPSSDRTTSIGSSATTPTTATATTPTGPTTPTSAGSTTSTSTGSTSTTATSTTATTSGQPGQDTRIVVHGIVTEVFTDCVSHLVLEDEMVVSVTPVSCGGGSRIVVDGVRIQTSSAVGGTGFDSHRPDLRPGARVNVNAMVLAGTGVTTLDCPGCGIRGG